MRERLAVLVDLMVDARQRSVVQPSQSEEVGAGDVSVRTGGGAAGKKGNEAVLRMLKGVLEGLGVDIEGEEVWEKEGNGEGSKRMDVGRAGEGEEGMSGSGSRFGWPELQLRAMRDAIGTAEMLPGESES